MSLIEGVGDEVIQFVVAVLVVIVAILAWWSTNARPNRYRTVLLMRSRPHHPVTVSIRPRLSIANFPANSSEQNGTELEEASNTSRSLSERPRENESIIPVQEMDSIVDADMAMLDYNRLHFYRRVNSTNNNQRPSEPRIEEIVTPEEPASNAQIREMDSIVSAMEADVTTGCDFFTRSNETNEVATTPEQIADNKDDNQDNITQSGLNNEGQQNQNSANATAVTVSEVAESAERERRKILIKLKFLNETLKEVEGNLDELLKDFKWRHFAAELSSESRVRLIFNGHVLVDDGATLQACGLHDRAVVHCLVHPQRSDNQARPVRQASNVDVAAIRELFTERVQPERAWDLENILMTLVSVALTVVWFFRCEYSNMFTASASVALFGLTVFYSVAIFGLYLSDTFHFDRRPANQPTNQPATNN